MGFGIKKLQITCVIEDAKVESMDAIIEDDLVRCAAELLMAECRLKKMPLMLPRSFVHGIDKCTGCCQILCCCCLTTASRVARSGEG